MSSRVINAKSLIGLLSCLIVSFAPNTDAALGQESAPDSVQHVHNAPESVTGTLKGNEAILLSGWRLLSDLAVRFLSGNEAEILSGNEPVLLSGNEGHLLSENDPVLLSANKIVLLSNNTLQIKLPEAAVKGLGPRSAINPPAGGRPRTAGRVQAEGQPVRLRSLADDAQAQIDMQRERTEAMNKEVSAMRRQVRELAQQNNALRAKLAEISEKLADAERE